MTATWQAGGSDKLSLRDALLAYIPSDRRDGRALPDQAHGAVLCADLSGFTPLTETLARHLGPRRGGEALAVYLNQFYEALIAPVSVYGGSVVAFSGDAITCWFDADDGERAIATAQTMQSAMQPFNSLQLATGEQLSVGVKIAIVSGALRRFRVGDPSVQWLDALAGELMDRLALLGQMARMGEILLDDATASPRFPVAEWRSDPLTGQRAARLQLPVSVSPPPFPQTIPTLEEDHIRPWLLPAVFARLQAGQGDFLTELRPAVALFMRFDGIDYTAAEAGAQLDAIIRAVQGILRSHDGTLLQLTIGDKGSYLYAAFGAPVAHEDDTARAISAALALRHLCPARIGISRGVMRTGAYGSQERRTYGVLGDEVNLAARLMEYATLGQILASPAVWQDSPQFDWQVLPALAVKGKRDAITPAVLLGQLTPNAPSPLPMIGRLAERARIEEKWSLALQGRGQIVQIVADAGMGKSRLLGEVLQATGAAWFSGECPAYGAGAYRVWHSIWRGLFVLEEMQARLGPAFALLGPLLNLSLPETDLMEGLDAHSRKVLRESLLLDCLRDAAAQRPFILVLDDVHWIDPLSADLLAAVARAIETLPVLLLLAHRPAGSVSGGFLPGLTGLPHATQISLNEMTPFEIGQLLSARLAQTGQPGDIPATLVLRLAARAQGNPFYAEELFNYLQDRGLDPRQDSAWRQADLPDSLHSLILSRIDQLSERQQITIKAASVIGRMFRAVWLSAYYPALGSAAQVALDLDHLSRVALIAPEAPEPHLAYLFRHVITQEVIYSSLSYANRAMLHEHFAGYLEQQSTDEDAALFFDLLAHHYEHSNNLPKKREYLRKAAESARQAFANEAALTYLGKALALAEDASERFDLLFARKQIYDLLGESELHLQDLTSLTALADQLDDARRAQAALSRSKYAAEVKDYSAALAGAQQAVAFARQADAPEYEARGYLQWANALQNQMIYPEARVRYGQALSVAQSAHLTDWLAAILLGFGGLDLAEANFESAQFHLERALQVQGTGVGHRLNQALALYTLGQVAFVRRDFDAAQSYYQQAVQAFHLMGKRHFEAVALERIGYVIAERDGARGLLDGGQ